MRDRNSAGSIVETGAVKVVVEAAVDAAAIVETGAVKVVVEAAADAAASVETGSKSDSNDIGGRRQPIRLFLLNLKFNVFSFSNLDSAKEFLPYSVRCTLHHWYNALFTAFEGEVFPYSLWCAASLA